MSDARRKQAEFMNEVNAKLAIDPDPHITFTLKMEALNGSGIPGSATAGNRSERATGLLEPKGRGIVSKLSGASALGSLRAVFKLALAEG
jgi:hypothetical protein